MSISQILKEKGDHVIAVKVDQSLSEAIKVMTNARIGAVLVNESSGAYCGILSERDIMRALEKSGGDAVNHDLREFMSANVHTVSLSTSIDEAMQMMTGYRCRHLPVLEEGAIMGMVSIGDLVNFKINETAREADALKEYIKTG